jgi:hypothetical protein
LIEAHQPLKKIWKEWSLKSRIKIRSFLEHIKISINEVFSDFESDLALGFRKLGNPTRETAKSNLIVMQNIGSLLFTLPLQVTQSDQ